MKQSAYLIILCFLILQITCSPKIQKRFATIEDVIIENSEHPIKKIRSDVCRAIENHAPSATHPHHTPIRYIRVNMHFIDNQAKTYNFNPEEARMYAHALIRAANLRLQKNVSMHLPLGNTTPILPFRYQYIIKGRSDDPTDDGIYFHYNDTLFTCNKKQKKSRHPESLYSHAQFKRYKIRAGEVLNVFFLEHPPDSTTSPTYKMATNGIGRSKWVKMVGAYYFYRNRFANEADPIQATAEFFTNLFNHELGHTLGLAHTWNTNDGCDDTPQHLNCWYYDPNLPPCDKEVSNNMMDYNAFSAALTPCQLGKIHYRFANLSAVQRKILLPTWCTYKREASIHIPSGEHIVWNSPKDLEGDLIVERGGSLHISCRVSMPEGSKIVVQDGATLLLERCNLVNLCSQEWQGIELWQRGEEMGRVIATDMPVMSGAKYGIWFEKVGVEGR